MAASDVANTIKLTDWSNVLNVKNVHTAIAQFPRRRYHGHWPAIAWTYFFFQTISKCMLFALSKYSFLGRFPSKKKASPLRSLTCINNSWLTELVRQAETAGARAFISPLDWRAVTRGCLLQSRAAALDWLFSDRLFSRVVALNAWLFSDRTALPSGSRWRHAVHGRHTTDGEARSADPAQRRQ